MKHRHTAARAACFFLLILSVAVAANALQRVSRAEERSQHLKGLLSLSEEQTTQVYAILKNHEPKPPAGKEPRGRRMSAKAERVERAAIDKEIEALLTPEQLKKYDSYKKARRSETDPRRRPRGEEYN